MRSSFIRDTSSRTGSVSIRKTSAGTVPTAAGLVSVLAEQVLPVGAAEEEGEAVQVSDRPANHGSAVIRILDPHENPGWTQHA